MKAQPRTPEQDQAEQLIEQAQELVRQAAEIHPTGEIRLLHVIIGTVLLTV